MDGDALRILKRIIRIGTVQAVDPETRRARVKFPDEQSISGWLYVLQRYDAAVHIEPDGAHVHDIESAGEHVHGVDGAGEHVHGIGEAGAHVHDLLDPATGEPVEDAAAVVGEAGAHVHTSESAGGHVHGIASAGAHTHRTGGTWYGEDRRTTHAHDRSYVTWWMPQIDDTVLCLYMPVDDADGYVLGGIK